MRNIPPTPVRSVCSILLIGGAAGLIGCGGGDIEISASELPPAVTQAVTTLYPGATMEEVEREEEDGRTVYEVELNHDGREIEVKLAADGTVLEHEED